MDRRSGGREAPREGRKHAYQRFIRMALQQALAAGKRQG
jgi:hypothetical protein